MIVGIFSALFGVGGGILMVPFMVVILEESQHLAEGTSLLVIVPTALAGAIAHHRRGYVKLELAARMAAGGVFGALAGGFLAHELDPDSLRKGFSVFVAVMGVRMAAQGLKEGRTKGTEAT